MHRTIAAVIAVAGAMLHSSAFANWTPGDIICVSGASGVGPGFRPAVLLVHPAPLSVSVVLPDHGITGDGAFDAYRNRVVIVRTGGLGKIISLVDSDASFSDLIYAGNQDASLVAPTGDGRIYFQRQNKFSYVDAAGVTRDVLNTVGSGIFLPPRTWHRMYFDPATHSLFMGGSSGINALITKIPLTPDGSRVAGAPIDTIFVTASLTSPTVVGFAPGPSGSIFIKLDDNSGATAPRMLLMEPASIDITVFANSGYFGVGGEIAGCYSSVLNAAIVVDSLNDKLRTFTPGSSGEGAAFSQPLISAGGSSGENATMFPITASAAVCPGDINSDGLVDDSDFILFVAAYNILDCADPSMPAGCPADFNHDSLVDDADFTIFVIAYNALLCP
ncbi:MAG: hypothetical protein KF805_13430 [Phycisphaeraceae bacterium]|nr:hypothetical protein [Phycisphaeraceae bacterium]